MNNITIKQINIGGQAVPVVDSREVAIMVDKRHSDLLESIKGYIGHLENGNFRSQDFFIKDTYKVEGNNKTYDCFLLTRKGCDMVANKMTGEKGVLFTAEYVTKFEEMENSLKGQPLKLTTEQMLELQFKYAKEVKEKVEKVDSRITVLEERMTIETGAQKTLCDLVNKKIMAVLGGKDTPAYKELSKKAYSQCWKDYKRIVGVASYKDTAIKDFDFARKVIIDWKPNRELELMIRGCNAQIRM
ncbi:ORF6C domain-containing protein [Clostridium sp.]|uniref:ORF6C domain-containing protein n=1 Tax=Clostridium sp. TaxID=1506 RepID=UPI001DCAE44E|nr:ORF6C domain-containing protein [Clostridium sp.]MBS5305785.1 ORF6C domain-containing protein [Clostridium sp.]